MAMSEDNGGLMIRVVPEMMARVGGEMNPIFQVMRNRGSNLAVKGPKPKFTRKRERLLSMESLPSLLYL